MLTDIQSRIYFITPAEATDSKQIFGLVQAAVRSGVGMIQYRAKNQPTRAMVEEAMALLKITRPARVPLIINDRVDVALAVGADGVHVGQHDMAPNDARRLMGPHAIVGVTAPELAAAREAEHAAASYISCGPIFASPTKPEKPPVGVEKLQRLQQAVSVPVCAIGGDRRGDHGRPGRRQPYPHRSWLSYKPGRRPGCCGSASGEDSCRSYPPH